MAVDKGTSWRDGVSPSLMREIDRRVEQDYGVSPLQLMEVAGLATARVARSILGRLAERRSVCVLAGPGNNGADGLVAARRLAGWGVAVQALTTYDPASPRGLSVTQLAAARAAGVKVGRWGGRLPATALAIDALLGFGSQGAPRDEVADAIRAANISGNPLLALDIPSGLDAESGVPASLCVQAQATVTLALPKSGLLRESAQRAVGELYLADIGVPRQLLVDLGIDTDGLFEADDIVRLPVNSASAG
jgi:NAD(P)H-hydrate epimerase